MKLKEFLRQKRWNPAIFAKEYDMHDGLVRKVVNETGTINLETALYIEKVTNGKVKAWDMSKHAEAIRKGEWTTRKLRKKKEPQKEIKNDDVDNK